MGIQELKDKIGKKAKGTHVSILSQSEIASSKEYLPTPSYDLNRILSGSLLKGLPSKTLSLFIGPEASGKSSFICLCLVEAQKRGYTPVIFDTEGAWDSTFVTRWGLDPDNILYVYTPWIDQIAVVLGDIIESGEKKMAIAIDSVGGTERRKLVDDTQKTGALIADQGALQKELKRVLKMILNICKGSESIAMASGHYYGNPSGYGKAEKIGGGFFMQLAPDIIVGLKKEQIKNGTTKEAKVTGSKIKAITLKNRYYPPFQEAEIDIDYINGINKWAGIIDLGMEAGIIERSGNWYSIGDQQIGNGKANAVNELENFKELILPKLEKWLETTGYSTMNENVANAEKLLEDEAPPTILETKSASSGSNRKLKSTTKKGKIGAFSINNKQKG